MTDRRAFFAGVCFALGGVPLALFYGFEPFGYLGAGLVALGVAIGYGARQVDGRN